jgi:hypothetical protein
VGMIIAASRPAKRLWTMRSCSGRKLSYPQ